MLSAVTCGLPICLPFLVAIPDRVLGGVPSPVQIRQAAVFGKMPDYSFKGRPGGHPSFLLENESRRGWPPGQPV